MRGSCVLVVIASVGVIALGGCREEVEAPTAPATAEEIPAFATAAALSFRQVSAGELHTCGLATSGLAYCWGANGSGQLGDGTTAGRWRPVAVKGGHHFVQISAGSEHTCAVTSDNHAYCWGSGSHGRLGDGSFEDRLTPVLVPGRLFRMIRAGFDHTCGVTTSAAAFCWGRNSFGQLGTGGSVTTVPTRVLGGILWKQVIAGVSHTCGVSQGNKGYCWGANDLGQLGDGSRTRRTKPTLVTGGLSFLQVVPGGGTFTLSASPLVDDGHTCGLTTGNKAYCWGGADGGANGTTGGSLLAPRAVGGGRLFQNLNTGWQHTCGITLSDAAFCWGSGLLGDGTFHGNTVSPVRVSGGHLFDAVTTGTIGRHSCAWNNTDHKAWCWGENSEGQLGDGTTTDRSVPVAVVGP
jgi:alpha-tubulin suppressor-like RCC1 family protein